MSTAHDYERWGKSDFRDDLLGTARWFNYTVLFAHCLLAIIYLAFG